MALGPPIALRLLGHTETQYLDILADSQNMAELEVGLEQ
jgi:hypothetical protein